MYQELKIAERDKLLKGRLTYNIPFLRIFPGNISYRAHAKNEIQLNLPPLPTSLATGPGATSNSHLAEGSSYSHNKTAFLLKTAKLSLQGIQLAQSIVHRYFNTEYGHNSKRNA